MVGRVGDDINNRLYSHEVCWTLCGATGVSACLLFDNIAPVRVDVKIEESIHLALGAGNDSAKRLEQIALYTKG